jgi:hypothetical protein
MRDPFLVDGPAVVSFSGGRTSGYMLWRILQSHGGRLPDDVVVLFANTGKEREETLRFVHECGGRWGVRIRWLEWRDEKPGFEEVGSNSCSRHGEPFAALIRKKGYLPNAVTRFCTQELKVRVMRDFARSLGWERWINIIGLRYDEGHRVMKALARNDEGKERFTATMPLSKARVTKRDVLRFWLGPSMRMEAGERPQGFDLGLHPHEGNCDLCFLKSRGNLDALIRDDRHRATWWRDQEALVTGLRATSAGARFVTEYSYADLVWESSRRPFIPGLGLDDEHDAECGLLCGAES